MMTFVILYLVGAFGFGTFLMHEDKHGVFSQEQDQGGGLAFLVSLFWLPIVLYAVTVTAIVWVGMWWNEL